jgi:hypothetical protein
VCIIDNEGRADEVEKKKQEHLKAQKEGKNTWEEGLASDSESAVCLQLHPTKSWITTGEVTIRIYANASIIGQGGSQRDGQVGAGGYQEAPRGGEEGWRLVEHPPRMTHHNASIGCGNGHEKR